MVRDKENGVFSLLATFLSFFLSLWLSIHLSLSLGILLVFFLSNSHATVVVFLPFIVLSVSSSLALSISIYLLFLSLSFHPSFCTFPYSSLTFSLFLHLFSPYSSLSFFMLPPLPFFSPSLLSSPSIFRLSLLHYFLSSSLSSPPPPIFLSTLPLSSPPLLSFFFLSSPIFLSSPPPPLPRGGINPSRYYLLPILKPRDAGLIIDQECQGTKLQRSILERSIAA